MSNDPRKDLEQLEMLLILDEEWFQRELDSAKRMIGQNPDQAAPAPRKTAPVMTAPPPSHGSANAQTGRRRPEPEEAPMPRRKGIKGLLILAVLEAMGILGLAIYWATVLLR